MTYIRPLFYQTNKKPENGAQIIHLISTGINCKVHELY